MKLPNGEIPSQNMRWELFLAFLRLGLTAFGGPAMVAYIRALAVDKKHWLTGETFADGVALCQMVPGATAMQTAAYVGLRAGGLLGALASFVGFGLPAFLFMLGLSAIYRWSTNIALVMAAFHGLQIVVVALIAHAALNFGKSSIKSWRDGFLALAAAVFLVCQGSPIMAILGLAAVALFLYHNTNIPVAAGSAESHYRGRRLVWFVGISLLTGLVGLIALRSLDRQLFILAAEMAKVDIFAFGGGFASIPLMLHEFVDVRHLIDGKTFMTGIALGQLTPGPIVITATFIGYQIASLSGAVVATLGIFTPSFLMVIVTVPYFDRLRQSVLFRHALQGVLASFVGLLLAVAINFGVRITWTLPAFLLAVAAFLAMRLRINILWIVIIGVLLSFLALQF